VDDIATARPAFRLGPATIVWLLGASQIVGYGTLYYSFSILADDVATTFGWPVAWLYGSFSLALLAGGLVAPIVGRNIDRRGAGAVMTPGSILCALTLLGAAFAPNAVAFTLAIVAMQAAAALVLYDAAFAALVQVTGSEARLRITHLTLIAGFASTLFWPLTSWLHGLIDWRQIFVVFAIANVVVCLPVHALIASQRSRMTLIDSVGEGRPDLREHQAAVPEHLRRPILWIITLGFAFSGFALSALLAQMVPILTAVGLGSSALVVSALFGPAQVLVRFVNMLIGLKRHPMAATLIGVGMLPLAILILTVTAPGAIGALVFAALLGFGSGLKSIVQGTLPLALFGSQSYGARLGLMAAVRQTLAAIAPFVFALLLNSFGAVDALLFTAAVAAIGLGAFVVTAAIHPTARS